MDYLRTSELLDTLDPITREVVGVFSNADKLHEAVVELDSHFPRHAISVLGGKDEIEEKFGQSPINPSVAQASNNPPLEAPFRSEEKVIGISAFIGTSAYIGAVSLALAAGAISLPATILAAVIGGSGGAAISAVLAKVLGDHYQKEIQDQIEKGGLLLWVNTQDTIEDKVAYDIMGKYGATHLKIITRDSV